MIRSQFKMRVVLGQVADFCPCMALADSCMQCNNPTGSFSFCSFLPFSPFWLLSTIFRWTANQSEDETDHIRLSLADVFHLSFPLSTLALQPGRGYFVHYFRDWKWASWHHPSSWSQLLTRGSIYQKREEIFDVADHERRLSSHLIIFWR